MRMKLFPGYGLQGWVSCKMWSLWGGASYLTTLGHARCNSDIHKPLDIEWCELSSMCSLQVMGGKSKAVICAPRWLLQAHELQVYLLCFQEFMLVSAPNSRFKETLATLEIRKIWLDAAPFGIVDCNGHAVNRVLSTWLLQGEEFEEHTHLCKTPTKLRGRSGHCQCDGGNSCWPRQACGLYHSSAAFASCSSFFRFECQPWYSNT